MTTLDRRVLIAGALGVAAAPALALAAPVAAAKSASSSLRFNILRNGKPFGSYTVGFVTAGDVMTVTTDVGMAARIAGMTVFDYKHHCVETWKGGVFQEMTSHSVRDNQSDQVVSAVRADGSVQVTNNHGLVSLPGDSRPLTHWNQAALRGPLFNPQDGYPLKIVATPVGRDNFALATGAPVAGAHWALRGAAQIDDWYDDSGTWLGLRGLFPDKSTVEYRRA